jgi:hypothetical protein
MDIDDNAGVTWDLEIIRCSIDVCALLGVWAGRACCGGPMQDEAAASQITNDS